MTKWEKSAILNAYKDSGKNQAKYLTLLTCYTGKNLATLSKDEEFRKLDLTFIFRS